MRPEISLDGAARSASVKTVEPTTCCVIQGPQLQSFLAAHPDFALHLIELLIKRIRSLLDLDDFGVICFLLSNEFYFLFSLRVRLDEASVQRAACAARRLSNSPDCVC